MYDPLPVAWDDDFKHPHPYEYTESKHPHPYEYTESKHPHPYEYTSRSCSVLPSLGKVVKS